MPRSKKAREARAAAQAGAPARNENEESEVQQVPPTTVVETPSIPSPPPSAVPKPTASTEPKPPAISPGAPADPKPAANTEQKTPVISPQVSAVSKPSASTEPKPPAISPGVPADPKPAANTEQKPPVISPQVSAVPKPSASTEPKPPVIAPGASVAPKPAASSHPPPRASSAYPTPSEAARSTSISKERPASKGARSQSALGGRRRPLLSAVPDSAVLAPIRRPDNGGSAGKTISVYTNHFRVTLDAVTINQYDVDIVFVGNDGKERSARKDERWEVMQRIAKEKKDFPLVWYDEGKTMYTRSLLPDLNQPIQITMKKGEETKIYRLKILDLVRQERIQNIFDFIAKKTYTRPREAVRIIEILFKQRARNELVTVRNQFYNRNQILDDLKDGRGMAKGFYQALFLTRSGPTLNVNLTFTCFYMPLNFVDFACKYLRKDITQGLSDYEARAFKKIIRDLLIETEHTGRPIRYKFRGFGLPANQLKFSRNRLESESGDAQPLQETSVAEYFEQQYKRKLRYPHLPCIDGASGPTKRANWLPMEVVKLVDWQRSLKPLDTTQRALVSKKTIIKPLDRYNQIMSIMQARDFETDVHLKDLNVQVEKKEMLQVKARILNPPEIRYRNRQGQGEAVEQVAVGKWRIRNRFFNTPEISTWGIIYIGYQPNPDITAVLNRFANELPNLLGQKGFIIRQPPAKKLVSDRQVNVEEALREANEKRWQLAIVILNTNNPDVYNWVKQTGNQRLGLRTQCVDMQALRNNIDKLHMYVDNLSQKINSKLGGINGVVNTKLALSSSSKEDLFMFFGADVTHSTCSNDRPSIAAVVGSRDPANALYAARLCEQFPNRGRCSLEIIKELDSMVADLLRVFQRGCGNRLPNKIVFYRDGVDEGQYQKVLDNEVTKIKNACRIVYGKQALPKLTFIVVKKRHNTRFFLYENGQTLNVEAGTVVDQDITHPSQFDFYLCSQAAIMGTSRPTLYHVLHDDIGFTSDEIQQLTYWLCHTDMRCSKSVSIPAPVHYAHLAAFGSRSLDFDDDRQTENFDGDEDDQPASYSIDDIKTKLMVFDPKVADDMWFV